MLWIEGQGQNPLIVDEFRARGEAHTVKGPLTVDEFDEVHAVKGPLICWWV